MGLHVFSSENKLIVIFRRPSSSLLHPHKMQTARCCLLFHWIYRINQRLERLESFSLLPGYSRM